MRVWGFGVPGFKDGVALTTDEKRALYLEIVGKLLVAPPFFNSLNGFLLQDRLDGSRALRSSRRM